MLLFSSIKIKACAQKDEYCMSKSLRTAKMEIYIFQLPPKEIKCNESQCHTKHRLGATCKKRGREGEREREGEGNKREIDRAIVPVSCIQFSRPVFFFLLNKTRWLVAFNFLGRATKKYEFSFLHSPFKLKKNNVPFFNKKTDVSISSVNFFLLYDKKTRQNFSTLGYNLLQIWPCALVKL